MWLAVRLCYLLLLQLIAFDADGRWQQERVRERKRERERKSNRRWQINAKLMNVCVTLMGSQANWPSTYVWLNTYTLFMCVCGITCNCLSGLLAHFAGCCCSCAQFAFTNALQITNAWSMCVCVWERGVDVCMQMKSGSGNTRGIRTQLVAFHNFRGLPKKSKCKKSHPRGEARLQFRFAHCASHLLRMQRIFEWENNAGAGSQRCRGEGVRAQGGNGALCWVRVVFAGFVCGVCLKFMTV